MAKSVLIARPHPFIVTSMKPFLEECGYATHKLESANELDAKVKTASGAVISLALSSSIPESTEAVFAQLHRTAPQTPVLFAALLEAPQAHAALGRIAQSQTMPLTVVHVDSPQPEWIQLGTPSTFLYLSKGDLDPPERRATAARMVQRHFR